jgi:hypothetical protein
MFEHPFDRAMDSRYISTGIHDAMRKLLSFLIALAVTVGISVSAYGQFMTLGCQGGPCGGGTGVSAPTFNWQNNAYAVAAANGATLTSGGIINAGDLLCGFVSIVDNTIDPGSVTPPPGFTINTTGTITGNTAIKPSDSGYIRMALFCKIAGASESGSYTASWTNSDVSSWALVDYGNVNASPFDGGAETDHNSGYGTALAAPTITTVHTNNLELFFWTTYGGGGTAIMPGGSVTTRVNQNATSSTANWIGMADLSIPTSGSQATQTATNANSVDGWGAISLGITHP